MSAAAKDAQADPGAKRGDGPQRRPADLDVMGRKVLVHRANRRAAAHAHALVMAFHGGGGSAAHMAKDANYGLQRKADEAGFIVAFPNGDSKFLGAIRHLECRQCCGDARDVDDGFARRWCWPSRSGSPSTCHGSMPLDVERRDDGVHRPLCDAL